MNRLPLAALLLLSACAPSLDYQHRLVGVSAEALLRCAGVPAKTAKNEGRTVWTYDAAEGGCAASVEFAGASVSAVAFDRALTASSRRCARIFQSCFGGAPATPAARKAKQAEPQPSAKGCPDGWAATAGGECYPAKPLFGGSTK